LCHIFGSTSQSKSDKDGCGFVCAVYRGLEGGRLEPACEFSHCPCSDGDRPCRLKKHSFRARKTGPKFPLRVVYCHTHQRHFTVYPMGHVPYGRESVAPLDLQGCPTAGEEAWQKTFFRCRPKGVGRSDLVEGRRPRRPGRAALPNPSPVDRLERSVAGIGLLWVGAISRGGCLPVAGPSRGASASEKRFPPSRNPVWPRPSGVACGKAFACGQSVVVSPSECGVSDGRLATGHGLGALCFPSGGLFNAACIDTTSSSLANEKVSS
jgi:hypothetical protein